ncbi:MAG: thiamine diphosphokinase, partial [Rectinema sp.]|nr:thiamine diphosphokinase [Rectinema sp.]
MRALVVTGGDCPPEPFIQELSHTCGFVIAADSGLDICLAAGMLPDICIGDFDSVAPERLQEIPRERIRRFPEDKDYTDTELALITAWEHGATRVALAGAGGGRLDHLLAVRALFERPHRMDEWHTAKESVYYLAAHSKMHILAPIDTLVSIFPLARGSIHMHSEGLKWPLDGLSWSAGDFGISNRTTKEEVLVQAGPRPILVVLPLGT